MGPEKRSDIKQLGPFQQKLNINVIRMCFLNYVIQQIKDVTNRACNGAVKNP